MADATAREESPSVTVLGGGTGTPKLLQNGRTDMTVVANTGDDVEFGDLFVCPDVDSSLFVAAGIIDTERWWGIAGDTEMTADHLAAFAAAIDLGVEPAYRPADDQTSGRSIAAWRRFEPVPEFMTFGDRDRALHRLRTTLLDRGQSLTAVTRRLGDVLGTAFEVLPMSDDPVATVIHTPRGVMHFQEYWVGRRGEPSIDRVEFRGIDTASPTDAVLEALEAPLVVIGPSNPVTSIGPIIGLPGVVDALEQTTVIAVSPFLGDTAFSGPAIDLMSASDLEPGTPGLVAGYPFVDGFVLDQADETAVDRPTIRTDIRLDEPSDATRVWSAIERLAATLTD